MKRKEVSKIIVSCLLTACLGGIYNISSAESVELIKPINMQVQPVTINQVQSNNEGVTKATVTRKGKLSKEEKFNMVYENGEYIDPADSVFELARPEIDEYRLSKYDKLNLQVVGYSRGELGFTGTAGDSTSNSGVTLTIGPDGRISNPYTGVVKLGGLTLEEASEVLSQRLSKYIQRPDVNVSVSAYGERQVYVMGEVANPGIYRLNADYMNVFAALSSAHGTSRKARIKHVQVVRVIDDKVYVREVNIEHFIKKQDIKQNIALQDGDMIYVPKSRKILLSDIAPVASLAYSIRNF